MSGSVVITGGHGDLGQALAAEFSGAEWIVDSPGRQDLDVGSEPSVVNYFSDRQIDLLVCAAGLIRDAPLTRLRAEDWDLVCGTNLTGAARCARIAARLMHARKAGHIVFISSYSALHPPIGQAAYATAKAGLIGLTRGLSRELGASGIRVNAVLPGFMETAMTRSVAESRVSEIRGDHALGRFNTAAIVARFIRRLHEELIHTSGQTFNLDSRLA